MDFLDDRRTMAFVLSKANALVVRSLTKFYAYSEVGYALSCHPTCFDEEGSRAPWSVNAMADPACPFGRSGLSGKTTKQWLRLEEFPSSRAVSLEFDRSSLVSTISSLNI